MPDTAVLGPLGLPAIAARGPLGVYSCSCSGVALCSDLLASARVAVAASATREALVHLAPRTPSGNAVHSPQLAGLHSGILPSHCIIVLVLLPWSILLALSEGLRGCLRGPVVLPFLCSLSGDVLL